MIDEEEHVTFDLEERLKEDDDGSHRAAIVEQLTAAQQSVKRTLDAGVPPGEFEKLKRMQGALEAAQQTVEVAAKHLSPQT